MKAVDKINKEMLMNEGFDILNFCEIYNPTEQGMEKIWKEYVLNKGNKSICRGMSIIDILSKHPDYIPEKGYIVKRNEYDRELDYDTIDDVLRFICCASEKLMEEVNIFPWSYKEIKDIYNKLDNIEYHATCIPFNYLKTSLKEISDEKKKWVGKLNKLRREYDIQNDKTYDKNSVRLYNNFYNLIDKIRINVPLANEENEILINQTIVDIIKESPIEIKGIRVGQKLNKVIGKICTTVGLDRVWTSDDPRSEDKYTKQIARLSDACSPQKYTVYTVVSANWIDYWTMSFGTSWCSCANIDKKHKRKSSRLGMYGDGCCSSGTESYMLDPSTVVMYTVSNDYDGKDFELQDKINRCLFHVGEDKFVMGRIYPQGKDGAESMYRQWRQAFQTILAECLEATNYWKTEKDVDLKLQQISSRGTHYRDYEMSYCNIAGWSWLKEDVNSEFNPTRIIIGHDPICPCCGKEHSETESIQYCGSGLKCYSCGEIVDEEDVVWIDERAYCLDCVNYCDYCEEYTTEEVEYVDNYYGGGYVCCTCLENSGDFFICDHCGEWHYSGNGDYIEINGHYYCCEECAENDGWVYSDYEDEWIEKNTAYYCETCREWFSAENYNVELEMCNNCANQDEEE